ncbi:MAG: hypothetical protein CMP84_01065 [Gammaproteobacteria bacterium]|nr:hypothetical protein [Gammaproteobacteria bacterium]
MFNSIKAFFEEKLANESEPENQLVSRADLACAALLIEVINSDNELDERETEEFLVLLQSSLQIPEEDLNDIMRLAEREARQATSLYEFTRLINDEYEYAEKVKLVENMWRVAFSDQQLDKYEEALIRKVADLLYVSHQDFIKTKLAARDS